MYQTAKDKTQQSMLDSRLKPLECRLDDFIEDKDRRDIECNVVRLVGECINFSPTITNVSKYGVLFLNVFKYRFSPIKIDIVYPNAELKLTDDDVGKWFDVRARYDDVNGKVVLVAYNITEVKKLYVQPTTEEYYTYYESREELMNDE